MPGRTHKPTPTPRAVPTPVVNTGALPRDVEPKLSDAANDWERIFADGCELQYNGSNPPSGLRLRRPQWHEDGRAGR